MKKKISAEAPRGSGASPRKRAPRHAKASQTAPLHSGGGRRSRPQSGKPQAGAAKAGPAQSGSPAHKHRRKAPDEAPNLGRKKRASRRGASLKDSAAQKRRFQEEGGFSASGGRSGRRGGSAPQRGKGLGRPHRGKASSGRARHVKSQAGKPEALKAGAGKLSAWETLTRWISGKKRKKAGEAPPPRSGRAAGQKALKASAGRRRRKPPRRGLPRPAAEGESPQDRPPRRGKPQAGQRRRRGAERGGRSYGGASPQRPRRQEGAAKQNLAGGPSAAKTSDPPYGAVFQGALKRHPGGFGFVIPKDSSMQDIYIPLKEMGGALTHDLVEGQIIAPPEEKARSRAPARGGKEGGGRPYGSIKAIVKRGREFVSGQAELLNGELTLKSHGLSDSRPFILSNPLQLKWKTGDWVRVKLLSGSAALKGEIAEILGAISQAAKDDSRRCLALNDIPLSFPPAALKEAEAIPATIPETEIQRRKDLRDKPFITIDGADAKDFDDSIFVEDLPEGGFRLYVAIADVSFYVREGGAIDKEAFSRGNSAYLPGLTSPMLPEKLSCDVCSINEGAPRLVMMAEMEFDSKAAPSKKASFYEAVIESRKRLTYAKAQDMLDSFSRLKDLAFLKSAEKLARLLIERSEKDGALDFNLPETVVKMNAQGAPLDIMRSHRLFSHRLIECFMLAANKAAALFLKEKAGVLIYRTHDKPDREKISQIALLAKTPIREREDLLSLLQKCKGRRNEALIHKLVLRAMAQASYSPKPIGHYGLNEPFYTHFTSPIRRYSDLIIHREIKKALNGQPAAAGAAREEAVKKLAKEGAFVSAREQAAVAAERQAKDIKRARFLLPRLGEVFEGAVANVTSFGFFVSLKNYDIEGLVRFRDLSGLWIADEVRMQAVAQGSRYALSFGDEVTVQAAAADEKLGKVDFKLLTHKGRPLPKGRPRGGRAGRGRHGDLSETFARALRRKKR